MPSADVRYSEKSRAHARLHSLRGSASQHRCAITNCGDPAEQWASVHESDISDVNNYVPMCYPCHLQYDMEKRKERRAYGTAI